MGSLDLVTPLSQGNWETSIDSYKSILYSIPRLKQHWHWQHLIDMNREMVDLIS